MSNDVYFYRAMLRKAQYCCWTSFVSPSVCNVAVFIVLWAYVLGSYFESIINQKNY